MGDIKLFRVDADGVAELPGQSVAIEKSLQDLIERNLEAFLDIRLLASEHSTGKTHAGRIDTLGLDENNCPIITKYDEHAVQQINRNIELFRYQRHEGFLVLELVNATSGSPDEGEPGVTPSP